MGHQPHPEHLGWGLRTCIPHKPGGAGAGGPDSTLRSSAPVPGWATGRFHHPSVEQTLWCVCYLFLLFLLTGRGKWGRVPQEPGGWWGHTTPAQKLSLAPLSRVASRGDNSCICPCAGRAGPHAETPRDRTPPSTPPPTLQAPAEGRTILSGA